MVNLGRWRRLVFGALSIIFVLAYLINDSRVCCKNGTTQGPNGDKCLICETKAQVHLALENRWPNEIIQTEVQAYISQFLDNDSANTSQLRYFDNKAFQEIQAICPFQVCDDDPCVPVILRVKFLSLQYIYLTIEIVKLYIVISKTPCVMNFIF